MKRNNCFLFTCILVLLQLLLPLALYANQHSNICQKAEADAVAQFNKPLWLGAGCLLGLTGILVGYLYEPTPPAVTLVGKDPEFVAVYTDCYKKYSRDKQFKTSIFGCVAGQASCCLLYTVIYLPVMMAQ